MEDTESQSISPAPAVTPEAVQTPGAAPPVDAPVQTPEPNFIEKQQAVAERIEAGNKEYAALVERHEKAVAMSMVGGSARAGSVTKTPEQEKEKIVQDEVDGIVKRFQ